MIVRRFKPQALLLIGATLAGCSGTIAAPGLGGAPTLSSEDGPPGSPGVPTGQADGFEAAPVALRKLTVYQYENTVADLFGVMAKLPELEPDTSINGFFAIGAAKATVSVSAAEKFESAAFVLAAAALDATHRDAFVGCTPATAGCADGFVARFGQRAFRRPLTAEEVARYVGLASQAQAALGGDFYAGLSYAIAGMLQAPSFLFRVELGKDGGGNTVAYDDYELATRLSYLLWNTTPDDALLAAASRGELSKLDGLLEQADRLIADPRAKSALDNFHSERLSLEEIDLVDKNAKVMPDGFDDALKTAMKDDVLDTIEDYTFGANTDFRELFTTRVAFVNSELATLYGLPASSNGRVTLPADGPRAGLLGKAVFLATYAHTDGTSPTKRGKFIRERMLCQSIPAPPPEVSTVLPEPAANAPTMRERLAVHNSVASCAGCHKLMDPIGLSLENFDAVGRWRKDDNGHALDVTGSLNGSDFDGALQLAELLHDEESAIECVARQLYRYATAHVETDGEEPAVQETIEAFAASGYKFSALLRAVIGSDGFRFGARQ
ncbi:MAG TPA: DUF1592 domain-containing protein [Polyangiales bacterium]|nr:DUF1592 domain-containing protein [Polyangiales bacterium]